MVAVTPSLHPAAHDLFRDTADIVAFGFPVGVDVGGVNHVATPFHKSIHHAVGGGFVGGPAKLHGAEGDGVKEEATFAKSAVAHAGNCTPIDRVRDSVMGNIEVFQEEVNYVDFGGLRVRSRFTMKSLLEGLPPEIAKRIHRDWQKNEAEYWVQRDTLLTGYLGQWIGFANGQVIVSGTSPVEVFHQAQTSGQHPFVTCVGHEHEPTRMRRVSFAYDITYPNEPLPVITVEFRKYSGLPGVSLEQVIPDTGADASALPWADCEQLTLDPGEGVPALMGGVGETVMSTVVFQAWVYLDGMVYPCRLQADFTGRERILGRDVLNRLEVLFNGPTRQVVFNP